MAQAAMLAQLRAEAAQLRATVEEVAQRLGRNSCNSSQLPSGIRPRGHEQGVRLVDAGQAGNLALRARAERWSRSSRWMR